MRKPRKSGVPRVRQINGVRFVLRRYRGGWCAFARYTGPLGSGSMFGGAARRRAQLLRALHDAFAPWREVPA